jgi:large subunit ribosomal protein L25
MDKIELKAEKRLIKGKKVRKLRKEGLLPLNLFGKDINSAALSVKFIDFNKVYQKAKNTQVVYLLMDKKQYPALIQNVQINPVNRTILHADLRKIDLKEKTEIEVPVVTAGELDVVKSGEADLMILQDKVLLECLPAKIPEKIIIDISKLEGIGAEVKIKDLAQSKDYQYLDDKEQVVLQIVEAKKEEIKVPEAVPEEGEAETKEGGDSKEGGDEKTEGQTDKTEAKTEKEPEAKKEPEPKK